MTKKWIYDEDDEPRLFYGDEDFNGSAYPCNDSVFMEAIANKLNELEKENEQLKKGMIGVVNRYIKNVDCNPPSSTYTYMKIKGALLNIREDLRDLIGDFE